MFRDQFLEHTKCIQVHVYLRVFQNFTETLSYMKLKLETL